MLLFTAQRLAQAFNGRDIFRDVNLEVQINEKVALVGPNGIGKSSLLNIIAGIHPPTAGTLKFYQKTTIDILSQTPALNPELTVREMLKQAGKSLHTAPAIGEVIKRFDFIGKEEQTLARLSGGEKTRLQLGCIWLRRPGLLLMDEPTNHLDMKHLDWLEDFVARYPGTIIIVSHDRYFLDHSVTRILELSQGGLHSYPGNYTAYARVKADQFMRDLKTYDDQEKQARKIQAAINAQYQWSAKAHREAPEKARLMGRRKGGKEFLRAKAKKLDRRVKSTIHRLESLQEQRIAKPKKSPTIDIAFSTPEKRRQAIFLAGDMAKSFGKRRLFHSVHLGLMPHEKVALTGPNGSGKTTLLKIILGIEPPDLGTLWRSPSLATGYLEQELAGLHLDRTVIEEITDVIDDRELTIQTRDEHGRARALLANLLMKGEILHRPCSTLSMGERVKVALSKLLLCRYDLLLLDEPTNYLDLESRERMEEALFAYSGALVVVSHDRYLLDKVCGTVWSIEAGGIRVFPGRYSEFKASCVHDESPKSSAHTLENEAEKLQLEYRLALITSQLAGPNAKKNPVEYESLEKEYLAIAARLRQTK